MDMRVVDAMGERAKRLPPFPRAVLQGATKHPLEILPQMDDEWQPIEGMWVLPGRRVLTTQELLALVDRNNWSITFTGGEA